MTTYKQFKKQTHIGIFELSTEEESVITLFTLFKYCDYKVSLFLSPRIWNRIENSINKNHIDLLTVFEQGNSFIDIYRKIKETIDNNEIDLIVFPSFYSYNYRETKKYIEFLNEYKVLVGVAGYGRWLSLFPPLRFNGIKIIKRGAILDWLYCHLVFKHISAYFMSEIHR